MPAPERDWQTRRLPLIKYFHAAGGSGSLVEGILQMLFVKNSMECRQRRREDPRTGSRATRCPEKKKSSRRREVWIPILARAHAGKLGCLLPTPSASSSICRGIGGKENGKRKKKNLGFIRVSFACYSFFHSVYMLLLTIFF